ncbi:hypothetical protein AMS68_005365 [Peltaster fructicola]|uniref:G domain-containing protein n=1 Tax=Peltaster fructicola TaxID=286661 RepID=A0A6H0XZ24_9PEZI|nr:hypothetical protein AMS68_005365 [Peltaster fructicola]
MVLAKSKNAVGLGNSLMNDRFGKGKNSNMHRGNEGAITRRDQAGNEYITNAHKEADWVKMRSVTEQGALDEFLSTAELAGTDFTAEKMNNVKIIHTDQKNPYLLSAAEERGVVRKQNAKRARLTVPRRPKWNEKTTPQELDDQEKTSLLEWRRGLAELQEVDDLLMTPLSVTLKSGIVDARNPLMFRCEDLERYVKEVDKRKRNLLLVNKADMMTVEQRTAWAKYFSQNSINFRFFSAELAREANESRLESVVTQEVGGKFSQLQVDGSDSDEEDDDDYDQDDSEQDSDEDDGDEPEDRPEPLTIDEQIRILTTDDLEALFLQHSPAPAEGDEDNRKTQIGLVGYPNVGKSSTINALLGAKKVSVSATPGKTKHFQTIHLSQKVVLCDCPGLVFPNFASTKAELVCAGVLPIDQLREYTGPAALISQRIPKPFLEAVYGIKVKTRPADEGGTGIPTGEELLNSYARARGFFTSGQGQPDESRAARFVLKDYVKGKLLFCHPPPADPAISPAYFNRELYDLLHLPSKRQAALAALAVDSSEPSILNGDYSARPMPTKTQSLDTQFFAPGRSDGNLVRPFHYKYSEQGGKQLSGRKLKTVAAMEKGVEPADLRAGKKHFKAGKKAAKKIRSTDIDHE